MLRFRAILHPTDFSEVSRPALVIARSLARDHRAKLVVLHVAQVDVIPGTVPVTMGVTGYDEPLEEIRREMDGPDLASPVETLLRDGPAAPEILRVAEELGCDLIAMGTHGRSGVGRAAGERG